MLCERTREKLERWGVIAPEPIFPPDYAIHPDELTPPPARPDLEPIAMRLALARTATNHAMPDFRPLCRRCHRPYNPDARLQRAIAMAGIQGCYQCASLDSESTRKTLEAMRVIDDVPPELPDWE